MSIKSRLKEALQKCGPLWSVYVMLKEKLVRVYQFSYHLYDLRSTHKFMRWTASRPNQKSLSAELLFQYHKLEKGLVMPGTPRLFGAEPSVATIRLLNIWQTSGYSQSDPIFVGAVETLYAYLAKIKTLGLDRDGKVTAYVERFLAKDLPRDEALVTPSLLPTPNQEASHLVDSFMDLVAIRRSVRNFKPDAVPRTALLQAITLASMSPSACNRQPWQVRAYNEPETIKRLLGYQNGNRGFGHLVPMVLMISVDQTCFFDASERNQPYIDGGLFSMSLIYALTAQGLATCCLNWCVPPGTDDVVHEAFKVPPQERIIMLLAVGYPPDGVLVPKSPRRGMTDVLRP